MGWIITITGINRMFKRNLMSASIASVLLTGSIAATANTQNDEEKDSVKSWGPWAKQYATAAGGEFNTGALAFASFAQGETGRNGQNEPGFKTEDDVIACSAGSACGFAFIQEWGDYGDGAEGVGIITGSLTENDNQEPAIQALDIDDDQDLPAFTVGFKVQDTDGSVYEADGLEPRYYEERFYWDVELSGEEGWLGLMFSGDELVDGHWDVWSDNGGHGDFVGGITTSLAQLNSFVSNLDGPTASYSGHTWDKAEVDVTINFSSKSWSGDFGASYRGNDAFSVQGGKLDGIAFTATSSQLSSGVTGQVSGALFGSGADAMAGLVDIEKNGIDRKTLFDGELVDDRD